MTPEEKANELSERFKKAGNMKILLSDGGFIGAELSKQCAIIAVEEIIEVVPDRPDQPTHYWKEVLNHLKNKS